MDVEASIEQVAGILVREDLRFEVSEDRRTYRLLFGSAAVFIAFQRWLDESVVITVYSPILQDIDEESPGAAQALNMLNALNAKHFFSKFTFQHGVLLAEYDLLGDNLQASELKNALFAIASAADELDDALLGQLGGKRYDTALEEWSDGGE